MEKIKNKIRKNVVKMLVAAAMIGMAVTSCVFLDSVSITQIIDGRECDYAIAGTEATFTMEGHINSQADVSNTNFVIAILAPKTWNVAKYAKVTYKCDLAEDRDQIMTMSLMPSNALPKNGNGLTWTECLNQTYGVGPNVLDDMEWVVFQTDIAHTIHNGDKPQYTIWIKTRMGDENLKCRLGFFVNHTDDGFSGGGDHKKVLFSDCFEVVNGTGAVTDYCSNHLNRLSPLLSLQDDFLTFSFIGSVADQSHLPGAEIPFYNAEVPVYFQAKAYGASGEVYEVNEKSEKTLMPVEDESTKTCSITFWPAGFFNVPDGEQLVRIEYFFTNKEGSIIIGQDTDDHLGLGKPAPDPNSRLPFVYTFQCN